MQTFQKISTASFELGRVQDNVDKALSPILGLPLNDGVLLEGVKLTAGQNNLLAHTLAKAPRLWIIVRKNADANVWEQVSQAPSKLLNLWCSTSCTVSLWVA